MANNAVVKTESRNDKTTTKQRSKGKKKLEDKKPKISVETQKRELIQDDLVEQLQSLGKFSKYHEDLINDYMFFWGLKNKMQRNINNKGLMITVTTGNGFSKQIINPNVKEIRDTNSSMMRILKELDIQQTASESSDDNVDYGKNEKL